MIDRQTDNSWENKNKDIGRNTDIVMEIGPHNYRSSDISNLLAEVENQERW